MKRGQNLFSLYHNFSKKNPEYIVLYSVYFWIMDVCRQYKHYLMPYVSCFKLVWMWTWLRIGPCLEGGWIWRKWSKARKYNLIVKWTCLPINRVIWMVEHLSPRCNSVPAEQCVALHLYMYMYIYMYTYCRANIYPFQSMVGISCCLLFYM